MDSKEQATSADNELINAIFDVAQGLIVVMDKNGRIVRFNKTCEQSTGYRFEEVKNAFVWDYFIVPEELEAVKDVFNDLKASQLPSEHTNYWLTCEGRRIQIHWRNSTIADASGDVEYVVSVGIDITEMHRNQDLLNQAQRIASFGSWDWNIETGDLAWSDEIYRLFGQAPQSFPATYEAFLNTILEEDRDKVVEAVNAAVADASVPYDIEHRILRPDNNVRIVHERGEVYRNQKGEPVRMIGTVQDVTVQKEAERKIVQLNQELERRVAERTEELEQSLLKLRQEVEVRKQVEASLIQAKEEAENANRLKSEFLSRMSHELRTPMNAILGFGQLLDEEIVDALGQEFIRELMRAGHHLMGLIDDVLDLSRIEAGKLEVRLESLMLVELVREAVVLTSSLAQQHNIQVVNQVTDEQVYIRTDRLRFKEIVTNLLSNGIKYNRPGGSVRISMGEVNAGMIAIKVTDTGKGIPAARLADIFEPFNRVGHEYSDIEGTGVGLTITRQLAHLLEGDVSVESTEGQGSEFTLVIPLAAAGDSETGHQAESRTPGGGSHFEVLYIEDNPANLRLVQQIIEKMPAVRFLSANTAEAGIELARDHRPDLILLDLNLPGMDGFEALSRMRNYPETENIATFAVSAAATPRDIERGMLAGFRRYITKPFVISELRELIQIELGLRPGEQSNVQKQVR